MVKLKIPECINNMNCRAGQYQWCMEVATTPSASQHTPTYPPVISRQPGIWPPTCSGWWRTHLNIWNISGGNLTIRLWRRSTPRDLTPCRPPSPASCVSISTPRLNINRNEMKLFIFLKFSLFSSPGLGPSNWLGRRGPMSGQVYLSL